MWAHFAFVGLDQISPPLQARDIFWLLQSQCLCQKRKETITEKALIELYVICT